MMRIYLAIAIASIITSVASGQDSVEVKSIVVHFNPTMEPKSPVEGVVECIKNDICKAAISAALAYTGVPPEYLAAAEYLQVSGRSEGEETRQTIIASEGYTICQVNIATTSVAPYSGDRASYFSAGANTSAVSLYSWTPKQGLGGGRSWWDGTIALMMVNTTDLGHVQACGLQDKEGVYSCRGDGNNKHNQQACGSATLGILNLR